MMVWLYWIISLTIVTLVSTYVVKKHKEMGFAVLVAFYTIYLGASQIMATRIVEFDLGIYIFFAPAAVFIYPFIAQAIDMINEVYGKNKAQAAILIALATQILLVLFIVMVNSLRPAPFFEFESAWQSLFSLGIRITVASWTAFLVCQWIDTHIFDWLKRKYPKQLVLRSVASDVANLTLDSLIFIVMAFWGVMPLEPLIIGQIVSKNLIGVLDTPWFVWYKRMLEKK